MQNEQIYLEDYDKKQDAYTFGILMKKADFNLEEMIRNYAKLPDFKKFFPIFRDTILGLTFLHK